jgi:hypothetical protein
MNIIHHYPTKEPENMLASHTRLTGSWGIAILLVHSLASVSVFAADGLQEMPAVEKTTSGWKFDQNFTVAVRFTSTSDGALFSFCRPSKWEPGAKMLGVRDGRLFYDVGWEGCVSGPREDLADGEPHAAVIRFEDGIVSLYVDGALDASDGLGAPPDLPEHRLNLGIGSEGFVGNLEQGTVLEFRYWSRALGEDEIGSLSGKKPEPPPTNF